MINALSRDSKFFMGTGEEVMNKFPDACLQQIRYRNFKDQLDSKVKIKFSEKIIFHLAKTVGFNDWRYDKVLVMIYIDKESYSRQMECIILKPLFVTLRNKNKQPSRHLKEDRMII